MMQWYEDVERAIEAAVGVEIADSVRTRWREHAARETVEVTLFGPYDSGKSSLLKRLLHEDGRPAPQWLTISARRETWETNEVNAHGLTFTDTPGVAAGNEDHERTATETITLTDAMLVVVPPQLLTGEKDLVLPVIDGRFFSPDRGWRFPSGALAFAITRLDEGGIDPGESPEAFRSFAEGKAAELHEMLARDGADEVPVHCVVADPYGLVGNDGGEYLPLGDADGVGGLLDALRALLPRKDELRAAARVRYLLHAGHHVAATVGQHLRLTELRAAELDRRAQDQRLVRGELEDLLNAASASLRNAINDEAQAVAEQSSTAETDLSGALASRVEARVAGWRAQWEVQLAELAERLAERYEAAEQRPMTALIDDLLAPAPLPVDRTLETATRTWDLIEGSAKVLDGGLRQAVQLRLGMDLETAHAELRRLEKLSADDLAKELASNPALKDLDRFRDVIGKATTAAQLAPIVAEVVRGLLSLWREESAPAAELKALEERRERLREASSKIADDVMASWRTGLDELLTAADRSVKLLTDAKSGVGDDIDRLREAKSRLDALLADAPQP